jgi:hypothetical protein
VRHDGWRLRKAAALVKLLALAPGHRLHREQIMNPLWLDSGRKAASNSLRKTLPYRAQDTRPGRGLRLSGERGRVAGAVSGGRVVGGR